LASLCDGNGQIKIKDWLPPSHSAAVKDALKNITIATTAKAHCQLRYFAGTNEGRIITALREHLDANGFEQVKIDDNPEHNGARFAASRTEPDHPWVEFVAASMQRSNNEPPAVLPGMGGSICNDLFTDDEHVLLPLCRNALQTMTGLYWDIGSDLPKPDRIAPG